MLDRPEGPGAGSGRALLVELAGSEREHAEPASREAVDRGRGALVGAERGSEEALGECIALRFVDLARHGPSLAV